jgi:hypothetical protein
MLTYTKEIAIDEDEGIYQDVIVGLEVIHYVPARPGRLYGPPEDCYPDEPSEIDWDWLDPETGDIIPQPKWITERDLDDIADYLTERMEGDDE